MSDLQEPDNQFDEFEESPGSRPQPPAGRNRTFLIAIGLIGAIFVIALIILLVTLFIRAPQQASQAREQADKINAQNTQIAATATFTPVLATATSVLAIPTATSTPTPTVSASDLTKTAEVKTQIAQGTKVGVGGYPGPVTTVTNGPLITPTGLPTTGFVDEVGLPGLFGLAALLLVVMSLYLVHQLARETRLEDCLMAGRSNCDLLVDPPPRG